MNLNSFCKISFSPSNVVMFSPSLLYPPIHLSFGVYSSNQVYGEVKTKTPFGFILFDRVSKNFFGSYSLSIKFPANIKSKPLKIGFRLQASPCQNSTFLVKLH